MSKSLTTLNNITALMGRMGLKSKEGITFSIDGECAYIKCKAEPCRYKAIPPMEGEVGKKGAKKPDPIVIGARLIPNIQLDFSLANKVDIRRILIQPNLDIYDFGLVRCPVILEPLVDNKVELIVENGDGVDIAALNAMPYHFRLYVMA